MVALLALAFSLFEPALFVDFFFLCDPALFVDSGSFVLLLARYSVKLLLHRGI